jgi:hypothetical protein
VHELIESVRPESTAILRLDHTADVTKQQADGKLVAMIGDGPNDALALAAPGRNGATNKKSEIGGAIPPLDPYATSNRPAAPIPPPTHIVITTYFTPRRLPSMSACPVIREPLIPYG